jgi:two-component system, sensor histidine kinase PdtaS
MPQRPRSLNELARALAKELREAYACASKPADVGGQPLQDAFDRFGREVGEAHLPLEDAMAAAVEVLQNLFDETGAGSGDPAIMLAAGIALAAVSRAYHAVQATQQDCDPTLASAPLPWLVALHHINRSATASLELACGLEASVRVVAETTGADACGLMLYDEATDSLALRAAVGLNPASIGAITVRPGVSIAGQAALERRVIAATDARSHPANASYPSTGEDVYASQISAPMLIRRAHEPERLVGVLNLFTVRRRVFSEDEIAFLQSVADELAISIENARLYSQTDAQLRRKITELGALQRVSHTIASTLDLSDVLRLISEQAVALFNAEAAAIFRAPSARTGSKETTAEHYVGVHRVLRDPSVRDNAVHEVIRTGSAQAIDLDYIDGSSRLFCLPLRSAREMLGALCIRLSPDAQLTEAELGMLQAFSDAATMAIENASLYQEARHGLETASALLQEMHHRVRNNLQTVAALLSLQARRAGDAPWAVHLNEAVSRIQAIAAVHDLLSDETRLAGTTIEVLAHHVASEAHSTLVRPEQRIDFVIEPNDVRVPSRQATIVALLINELVANSVYHGFDGGNGGTIRISAAEEQGIATLRVENDGASFPEGFDPAQSRGLGMRIIQRLVTSDLHGRFHIGPGGGGTVAVIEFPLAAEPIEAAAD